MNVELVAATLDEKPALRHLLELYAHDFSEFTAADVDADGRYGYRDLDAYWLETERHPFLIRADDHLAGFALVRAGRPHDMAEFFVMRKYRGTGVALEAARNVFARFPGDWQVRELAANAVAIAFWRRAIPVPFDEGVNTEGPIQTFRIAEIDYPVVMAARERLRAIFGAPWGRPPETMTLVGTARTTGDSAGLTIRPCGGTSAPRTAPRSR